MGLGCGVFNLAQNLWHWFIGFEYWHVAVSPPEVKGYVENEQWPEWKIAIVYYLGIVLNVVPSFFLGYYEWNLGADLYTAFTTLTSVPQSNIDAIYICYYDLAGAVLVSTAFFIDAIRRVGNHQK